MKIYILKVYCPSYKKLLDFLSKTQIWIFFPENEDMELKQKFKKVCPGYNKNW